MISKELIVKKMMDSMYDLGGQLTSKTFAQLAFRMVVQSVRGKYDFLDNLEITDKINVSSQINYANDSQLWEFMDFAITKLGLNYYKKKIAVVLTNEELVYLQQYKLTF